MTSARMLVWIGSVVLAVSGGVMTVVGVMRDAPPIVFFVGSLGMLAGVVVARSTSR